ncbi:hypothetical protein B6N60_00105 [Richelia sinica FACHB-800]|uniref:Uncharacterized protein n=1 Tax=Richelia sinica FACHB-800 TaxID=1357546 RepID=A0A975T4U8_9NOST|nr:hypothetical protein B6N60_00105 [Richelia sinica FACHB-800]
MSAERGQFCVFSLQASASFFFWALVIENVSQYHAKT